MPTITVTRNAQITIPKKLREKLGIKVGDTINIRLDDSKIILERAETPFESGFLPKGFDTILKRLRTDSKDRFKRLGILP
ncbi:MAG: AbrB/MazE/SpoVT family DNA-binding domain-containing protein [Candidatus Hydrothermarchaeales archaeon]